MKKKLLTIGLAALAAVSMSMCASADGGEMVLFTWEGMFPQEVLDNFTDQSTSVVSTTEGLEELVQKLKHSLITGVTVSAKNLDERMVALGFITKKSGFGGVVDMLNELNATGKINYQLRKKSNNRTVIAEIIGEQDSQSQLFDKIVIKKVYLHEI